MSYSHVFNASFQVLKDAHLHRIAFPRNLIHFVAWKGEKNQKRGAPLSTDNLIPFLIGFWNLNERL